MYPTITGVARLTEDPREFMTQDGGKIASLSLAFNSSRKNAAGEWVPDEPLFLPASCFSRIALRALRLKKGQEVMVTGVLRCRKWQNKAGDWQTAPQVSVKEIAIIPSADPIPDAPQEQAALLNQNQIQAKPRKQPQGMDPWSGVVGGYPKADAPVF